MSPDDLARLVLEERRQSRGNQRVVAECVRIRGTR